jgi:hypothetical protein
MQGTQQTRQINRLFATGEKGIITKFLNEAISSRNIQTHLKDYTLLNSHISNIETEYRDTRRWIRSLPSIKWKELQPILNRIKRKAKAQIIKD